MKLLRNLLADAKLLINDGSIINWDYITKLYNLQENEGLRAGNKLNLSHIQFYKQKMKVKLAVQVFSASVGKVLAFAKNLNIFGFDNCDGTIEFILLIDKSNG
ncbi:unnamed protein product [Gordionus sp. m RMFG-2023]